MKKRTIVILIIMITNLITIPTSGNQDTQPSNHIIENVPYVGQETSFYCLFACPTMAIKYHNINTTLKEVLFSSGVGYSMIYSHPSYNRVPIGGNGCAWWKIDRTFLGELYGLTYTEALINIKLNEKEETWDLCQTKFKENISENKPVIIQADPLFLPSLINSFLIEIGLEQIKLPYNLLQHTTTGFFHVILLTGYNEENNSFYYHDPLADLFNHPEEGYYAEITMNNLKQALFNAARNQTITFGSFTDSTNTALSKKERFLTAHNRNIEKMIGNPQEYDKNLLTLSPGLYGIQVLKQFQTDISILQNKITTALIYKMTNTYLLNPFFNIIFHISDTYFPEIFKMTDWQAFSNYFYQLSVEKHNISQYLLHIKNQFNEQEITDLCLYEANMLEEESKHWSNMSIHFNEFMKKGIFLPLPKAIQHLNQMNTSLTEIIEIQEAIIQEH